MARRKTLPESLRAKLTLAERLSSLRLELFGDRGGPEMARRLGIPVRTWYNYEGGGNRARRGGPQDHRTHFG